MTLLVYSLFALPLWGVMFVLFFLLKAKGMTRAAILPKCAGSFLSVASVAFCFFSRADLTLNSPLTLLRLPLFWFFVLCTAADAVLEVSFLPGMALFACAHFCLIATLFPDSPALWALLLWVLAMAAAAFLFRRELSKMGASMAVPCVAYMAVLSASLGLSLPLPFVSHGSPASCAIALGTLSIFVSDMMVAKAHFNGRKRRLDRTIMVLYWLGLYLLSGSLWLGQV